jgi:hypothetical protein
MSKNIQTIKRQLFNLLDSRGFKPTSLDMNGKNVSVAEAADVFQFKYITNQQDHGSVTVSIDGSHNLVVYFSNTVTKGDKWFDFLKTLKKFATQYQLSFETKNFDKLNDDMNRRKHQESQITESFVPINRTTSCKTINPSVKLLIVHSRNMRPEDQRFRAVDKIFIETAEGERFLLPVKQPALAKIYARHVAEGGSLTDERGGYLNTLIQEFVTMNDFCRATGSKQFNEFTNRVVEKSHEYKEQLKETLLQLMTHRGYNKHFDELAECGGDRQKLLSEQINDDESFVDDYNDLLQPAQGCDIVDDMVVPRLALGKLVTDPRVSTALPIVCWFARNHVRDTDPYIELDDWARTLIQESLYPNTTPDVDKLAKMIDNNGQPLELGSDALNAINAIESVLSDDSLNTFLKKSASKNPEADARPLIKQWIKNHAATNSKLASIAPKLKS